VVDRNATVAARPRSNNDVREEGDPLEQSGQAILGLLRKASDGTNATYDQAMNTAQKLSDQVRAAEDRVQLLESELQQFAERAARAEKWLARIHDQVEQEFFGPNSTGRLG
jgi:predicted  nucleic acid-binding Zn-ribbon protein